MFRFNQSAVFVIHTAFGAKCCPCGLIRPLRRPIGGLYVDRVMVGLILDPLLRLNLPISRQHLNIQHDSSIATRPAKIRRFVTNASSVGVLKKNSVFEEISCWLNKSQLGFGTSVIQQGAKESNVAVESRVFRLYRAIWHR